jgi:hypothetical protein
VGKREREIGISLWKLLETIPFHLERLCASFFQSHPRVDTMFQQTQRGADDEVESRTANISCTFPPISPVEHKKHTFITCFGIRTAIHTAIQFSVLVLKQRHTVFMMRCRNVQSVRALSKGNRFKADSISEARSRLILHAMYLKHQSHK